MFKFKAIILCPRSSDPFYKVSYYIVYVPCSSCARKKTLLCIYFRGSEPSLGDFLADRIPGKRNIEHMQTMQIIDTCKRMQIINTCKRIQIINKAEDLDPFSPCLFVCVYVCRFVCNCFKESLSLFYLN